MKFIRSFLPLFLACSLVACAQKKLSLIQPQSGLRLIVIDKNYPLLKILLPGQPDTDRGIEVEFPEHVTGLDKQNGQVEHLYLTSDRNPGRFKPPVWKVEKDVIEYEKELGNGVRIIAKARLQEDGVDYSYQVINKSSGAYDKLQAVTCVKLYSLFSDTLLERTYVHHEDGFDLLAAETPQRLTMPLSKWLPCRYMVSYTWPIPADRIRKNEDSITIYNKSRRVDKPFMATLSHDKKWIAATYTSQTGNLWTNPERSCQHADPSVNIAAGETRTLQLKTFIIKGTLEDILKKVEKK